MRFKARNDTSFRKSVKVKGEGPITERSQDHDHESPKNAKSFSIKRQEYSR